ncbi:MAG TPA: hypothetical protein VLV86_08985, partial [Vicinamibacterales bacterium]|nr:hypothetical protein [Vicinamibacterales bacterium]
MILLLAGRRLPPPLFDQFASEVEALSFVFAVTHESTRAFERACARWAPIVHEAATRESLVEISRHFALAKSRLATRMPEALARLWNEASQSRVRDYVLRKLPEAAELVRAGDMDALARLAASRWHLGPALPSIKVG